MEWPVKTLGDVCIVERGSSPRPIQDFQTDSEDGVNWIKIGDTKGVTKYLTNTKEKITREGAKKSRLVEKGDFILSNSMSFGKPYIMATSGYIHDGWFALRLPEDIDPDFFYHLLSSPLVQDQFQSLSSGAIVKNISGDLVKKTRLPIPPISEQKRIVAILDQVFADIEQARAKTEQNLKNARELFESYLQQVFSQSGDGWVEAKLSDVCEGKITDGTHQTPKYFDEGYIFLSSRNVTSGEIDWNNIKYIDEAQHVAMQKRLSPRVNDILLAKNGTTGVAAIVDKDVVFDIYVSLALLRPSNKIVPRYLLHFVNSSVAKSQFNKRLKGAGVPNLHLEEIREVLISYPTSIKKQQQLLKQIDLLLEQRNILVGIYTRKLAAIDELKKSILQKAFTGQLTNKKSKGVAA